MTQFTANKNIYTFKNEKMERHFDINTGIMTGKRGGPVKTKTNFDIYNYNNTEEGNLARTIYMGVSAGLPLSLLQVLERVTKYGIANSVKKIDLGRHPQQYLETIQQHERFIKSYNIQERLIIILSDLASHCERTAIKKTYNISDGTARFLQYYPRVLELCNATEIARIDNWITQDHACDVIIRLDIYIIQAKEMGLEIPKTHNLRRWAYETKTAYQEWYNTNRDTLIKRNYSKVAPLWNFEYGDFTIMIPTCGRDLVREGNLMHHCVGRYTDKVANNEVYICFVRKKNDIETPYITCEIRKNGYIYQYYLAHDRNIQSCVDKEFKLAFQEHITRTIQEYGLTL